MGQRDPGRSLNSTQKAALTLLLQRLTWPSALVREKACEALARLIVENELGLEVQALVLNWMAKQTLESIAVLGLLVLYQVKMRGKDLPDWNVVSKHVSCPSILSWQIAKCLYGEIPPPELYPLHSGTSSGTFQADPFFLRWCETYLPRVYLMRAKQLELNTSIPFVKHWSFEWTTLRKRAGAELKVPEVTFWTRQDSDHLGPLDLPMSEIYRSAFLRSLAWGVFKQRIPLEIAEVYSAEACPVDLSFWKVQSGPPPEGWPDVAIEGTVDTAAGQLTTSLAALWARQTSTNPLIAEASGRVVYTPEAAYDLSIRGFIQRAEGNDTPALADLLDDANRFYPTLPNTLCFDGYYESSNTSDAEIYPSDWRLWPLSLLARPHAGHRWQYWKDYRGVWLPNPVLSADPISFRCTPDAVLVESNGQELARWTTWTSGLEETLSANLPPATGQALFINRHAVEKTAERLGGTFAWICRISSYHRRHGFGEFDVAHIDLEFGTTRIIHPKKSFT